MTKTEMSKALRELADRVDEGQKIECQIYNFNDPVVDHEGCAVVDHMYTGQAVVVMLGHVNRSSMVERLVRDIQDANGADRTVYL